MNKLTTILSVGLAFSILGTSCKKKSDDELTSKGNYIVVATPGGTMSEGADYVMAAPSLDGGSISTTGNGIEQDGYRYFVFHKNKAFSLLYGQGNPGAVTAYKLNADGAVEQHSNLQTESVHVFGTADDDIVLIKVPRSATDSIASIYRVNADNPSIVATHTIDLNTLAGNGERAYFTGAFQVGHKLFVPYMCIKAKTGQVFHTNFTDSTWIAVFSYPGLELEKVIKDNRTSYIGYYFAQNGVQEIENGDVYAFSNAVISGTGVVASTKPSAVVRIPSGTTEFDSYFWNIETASGGHHLYREDYIGNGKFLLQMYTDENSTSSTKNKYAIADVVNKQFTWVTGLPAASDILHISRLPHVASDKQTVSVGITTAADGPYVYRINASTAVATRGLKVEAGVITTLGELSY
ncbi:MAG: DUF4374 domain-containing protein [Cytophagaceae bacterium]